MLIYYSLKLPAVCAVDLVSERKVETIKKIYLNNHYRTFYCCLKEIKSVLSTIYNIKTKNEYKVIYCYKY